MGPLRNALLVMPIKESEVDEDSYNTNNVKIEEIEFVFYYLLGNFSVRIDHFL